MGFFDFIKNLFTPSLDDKIAKISRRIEELKKPTYSNTHNNKTLDLTAFDVDSKSTFKTPETFQPGTISIISTMRSLKERRIELEKKRIENLREQVNRNLESAEELVKNEQVDNAENLLVNTFSALQELKDSSLLEIYSQLLEKISIIKEELRQKEIERKRLEKEKEEEARRKLAIEEQERKAKLEQERLRKEREAREYEERLRSEAQKRELERRRLFETVTCKKTDGDKFIDYLKRKGISCFYHFTDEQNLASIRRHGGLYSWYYCKNNGIDIPYAGGSSDSRALDTLHGLQDYVRLSFCSDHPMQYRLQLSGAKLVLLKIKIDVAAFKDTQFSNMNAAANAVEHGASFEDLERVNIYAVKSTFVRKTDDIFHEHQAECMVKTFIPIDFIINIDHPQRL